MSDDGEERVGFELDGEFLPLAIDWNHGKDLMLIDRITGMGVEEFIGEITSGSTRTPVMLATLATSYRARHPEASVERIYRIVTSDLSDLKSLGPKEDEESPPAVDAPAEPQPSGVPETSSSAASSGSSTPKAPETEPRTFDQLYGTPVS